MDKREALFDWWLTKQMVKHLRQLWTTSWVCKMLP